MESLKTLENSSRYLADKETILERTPRNSDNFKILSFVLQQLNVLPLSWYNLYVCLFSPKDGFFSPKQVSLLKNKLADLLAEIRPNAVALVDAFDYPDKVLDSCLGRYDGQVYQALYDYAKSSPLNQQEVRLPMNNDMGLCVANFLSILWKLFGISFHIVAISVQLILSSLKVYSIKRFTQFSSNLIFILFYVRHMGR